MSFLFLVQVLFHLISLIPFLLKVSISNCLFLHHYPVNNTFIFITTVVSLYFYCLPILFFSLFALTQIEDLSIFSWHVWELENILKYFLLAFLEVAALPVSRNCKFLHFLPLASNRMLFGDKLLTKQIVTKLWYLGTGFQVIFWKFHPYTLASGKHLSWSTGREYLIIATLIKYGCTLCCLNRQKLICSRLPDLS